MGAPVAATSHELRKSSASTKGLMELTSIGVEDLWNRVVRFLELLEEVRGDGKEINARKRLDFTGL